LPNLKNFYRFFKHNSKGFSLIEVMIALALMAIIGVAFLGALATASKAILIADEQATAESLARSQMEYVKNQDYIDYSEEPHDFYDLITPPGGYEIDPLIVEELQEGLQKITVTVNHYGKSEVIVLDGYKVDR
jgi:prepilin-type N-terminal cleavage/methylation domain-containing protein